MAAIPTTTSCYVERIATLQERLRLLLAKSEVRQASPDDLELLEQELQPVYAAIWAMYAEVEQDEV
jgi:septum formation topological specificity factor MinE